MRCPCEESCKTVSASAPWISDACRVQNMRRASSSVGKRSHRPTTSSLPVSQEFLILARNPRRPKHEESPSSCGTAAQRLANFPLVSKRIGEPPQPPAVRLILNRVNDARTRCNGPREPHIRIVNRDHDPHRAAAQRLGTRVVVLGRFIGKPKFRALDRQSCDDIAVGIFGAQFLRLRRMPTYKTRLPARRPAQTAAARAKFSVFGPSSSRFSFC